MEDKCTSNVNWGRNKSNEKQQNGNQDGESEGWGCEQQ